MRVKILFWQGPYLYKQWGSWERIEKRMATHLLLLPSLNRFKAFPAWV